jgi:hypothetical protein
MSKKRNKTIITKLNKPAAEALSKVKILPQTKHKSSAQTPLTVAEGVKLNSTTVTPDDKGPSGTSVPPLYEKLQEERLDNLKNQTQASIQQAEHSISDKINSCKEQHLGHFKWFIGIVLAIVIGLVYYVAQQSISINRDLNGLRNDINTIKPQQVKTSSKNTSFSGNMPATITGTEKQFRIK